MARREPSLHSFGPQDVPVQVAPDPPARSVGEVVAAAQRAIGADPGLVECWVRGEISGYKRAASGHWYFDLKDESAVLNAAMFRGANARVRFEPQEGMEVLARGRVGVYASRSALQIVVDELRAVGVGELALAFEQLRRRLEAEGLFAPERKVPLPETPRRVGIVTSLQAAALRDMCRVATQRHPGIQILVAHARVQGDGAAAEIASAIARLDARGDCDVIIVGRGGGSIEDLWAFNEEAVVRAVAACRAPIVSAVGHETDVTLCDLAADLRAATPSQACEIVVPDAEELLDRVDAAETRAWDALERLVPELRQRVDELDERAGDAARRTTRAQSDVLALQAARLQALSPLAILARGFAVVRAENGALVRRVDDAPDRIEIVLQDGRLDARVTGKRKEGSHGQDED